jgi:hypothetical protein
MFEAKIDLVRNSLTIRYWSRVEPGEVKRFTEQLPGLLLDLHPGFSLLTDMSDLESMDLECVPHLKTVMNLCNEKKVGMVVRVIPDPRKDIGLNILSLFHYDRGVRFVTCKTLDEGRRFLE